ncbi:MAG: putative DNA binding domain-containing protein [Bacteroidales bacterium]|nr:putative DNA binding domain-containing protein [Clostridium sp.]MCM1203795.1 putative DNA binding domain-containing protein [Bacteroidales bacterium]
MAESQNVEWKQSWKDEYLKWICGFANAQGGKIYIGAKDDGTVVGLKDSKKLLEDIPNKIQNKLGIVADVNLLAENGLEYIEIIINPWAFPVNYNGEYHYRSGSTKQQLRGNALTNFLMAKTGMKWDAATISNISVSDLDKESFDIFKREALRSGRMTKEDLDISDEELLEKLDLIVDGKLKRAGALCFYRNPEKVIGGCYVKIGKFEGSELLYQDEVHGSLLIMADRVIDLIYLKYLKAAVSYYKDTRVETYPFAREAVREAVFNALIHCNWADNVPVQIRIEEDVMFVSNCSMLPFGWTAETLLGTHTSKPYNPDIAKVFYRAGYIESWGRGIQKICDACKDLGTDEPVYIVHGEDIMVKFKALQGIKASDFKEPKPQSDALGDALEDKLMMLLKEKPHLTQKEMVEKLSVSRATIQRLIKKLDDEKKLERVGGKRYGYWKIH